MTDHENILYYHTVNRYIVTMTMWQPVIDWATVEQPFYAAIADALTADIISGRLAAGDRLPTQRALSVRLGVSLGTITRAYEVAERRGIIEGITGRGTFVRRKPVERFRQNAGASSERHEINLQVMAPVYAYDPDLVPALNHLARHSDLGSLLQYQPNAGMLRHRAAGADWLARFGIATDAESVLITSGGQHALIVALAQIAEPGDVVVTQSVTYPGIKPAAQLLNITVQGLPYDEQGLIPEGLESACKQTRVKALYIDPTLQNPTTSILPVSRRHAVADIAMRYGIAVVEDLNIHGYTDDPPVCLATLAPDRTFVISSLSKCVAGGLRIAYLAGPKGAHDALVRNLWATTWMAPPLMAEIGMHWIENGVAMETMEKKKKEIKARSGLLAECLKDIPYIWNAHALHAWIILAPPWTGMKFTDALQGRGVLVTPAETFAVQQDDAPEAVRICLSSPWDYETLHRGLDIIRDQYHRDPPDSVPTF